MAAAPRACDPSAAAPAPRTLNASAARPFSFQNSRTYAPQGLELTSPVAAAALQPAVPVFTFCFALAMRTERITLRRRDGWVTLAGVAVVVMGALSTGAF